MMSCSFRPLRWLRSVALASFCAISFAITGMAVASENLAIKTLAEQAQFWEGKGRTDLAATAWKRLLQIQPNNPHALAGLAQFELDSNNLDSARALADQLKRLPQGDTEAVKRIEGAAAQKSLDTELLEQARQAAKAGRADEAVGLYRRVLDGRTLTGPLALEYYQTLGGTAEGWDGARRGLEKLRNDSPNNHAVGLAYAQHLTYRPATRREGIRLLAELSNKPAVAQSATQAWRRALVWLEASKADLPLFQSYLKGQPNDAEVRSRMAVLNSTTNPRPLDVRRIVADDGFTALNAGDVGEAEKRFEGLLAANPKNPDGLGGVGVVRLKQERFAEAENLLSAALRISGNNKWSQALNTSRFWIAMQEGQAKFDEGKFDLAVDAYERAQKIDSKAQLPRVALVNVLMQAGQFDAAQKLLDTLGDGPERREASYQMVKRKASKAVEAKEYAEAERLLSAQAEPLDTEGQELLAWAFYHQNKFAQAVSLFAKTYNQSPTKGAAAGLVFGSHKLKSYQELLSSLEKDTGLLRDLVSVAVQKKIKGGETRFELDNRGRLIEADPILLLTQDVLWPATQAYEREKNPKKAYDMLLPHETKLAEIGDFASLTILGLSAAEVGDQATELRTLKKAAEETEDEAYIFMFAQSLIKHGKDQEAEEIMVKQIDALDSPGLTLLGWTHYRLGRFDQAVARFSAAYAKEPTENLASAIVLSADKAGNLPLILKVLEAHPGGPLESLVAPDIRPSISAGEKKFWVNASGRVVAIQTGEGGERAGLSLKLEPHLRSKSGAAGEGKLRQGGLVATLSWQGETYRTSLEVEHQHATDGVDRASGPRWYAKWGMKMASSLDLQFGVGKTLGGGAVVQATVGEVGISYLFAEGSVGARVFRRGSEESLLALSGTPDATTGISWGRALESGVTLNANHRGDTWSQIASLTVSRIDDGVLVAGNRKVELYSIALRALDAVPGLSVGPELYFSRFNRNLSAFEPGHGGYFSPRRSITIGIAGKYETRHNDIDLTFLGGLGWAKNRIDSEASSPITGANPGRYPATTGSGLAYHARIQGVKPLSPNWSLGFGLGRQKGSGFSDWRANVFVQRRWLD